MGEEDYGEYCQKLDMDEKTFEIEKKTLLSSLEVNEKTQQHLKQMTVSQSENN